MKEEEGGESVKRASEQAGRMERLTRGEFIEFSVVRDDIWTDSVGFACGRSCYVPLPYNARRVHQQHRNIRVLYDAATADQSFGDYAVGFATHCCCVHAHWRLI